MTAAGAEGRGRGGEEAAWRDESMRSTLQREQGAVCGVVWCGTTASQVVVQACYQPAL